VKARFFKSSVVQILSARVKDNLNLYRAGTFDEYINEPANYFESELEINGELLAGISCEIENPNEVDCCIKMYQSLQGISHYLARDERLWVYLSHTCLLEYTRLRWPIPADEVKAIKHIQAHFFCVGARGIERDNTASRLWWMASLCNRTTGVPLTEALTCFLYQSDVRANIVERPTTSQNVAIFTAVLKRLSQSYRGDKALFGREKFRSIMKGLNLRGGVKLLATLPEPAIERILEECIAEAG
jgi:Family of unknown function (DUF6339)